MNMTHEELIAKLDKNLANLKQLQGGLKVQQFVLKWLLEWREPLEFTQEQLDGLAKALHEAVVSLSKE